MISPKEFICTECLYFFVARDMSRPMGRRRKRNTCFTLTYLPQRREGAKRTETTKLYFLILSSGKKKNKHPRRTLCEPRRKQSPRPRKHALSGGDFSFGGGIPTVLRR